MGRSPGVLGLKKRNFSCSKPEGRERGPRETRKEVWDELGENTGAFSYVARASSSREGGGHQEKKKLIRGGEERQWGDSLTRGEGDEKNSFI